MKKMDLIVDLAFAVIIIWGMIVNYMAHNYYLAGFLTVLAIVPIVMICITLASKEEKTKKLPPEQGQLIFSHVDVIPAMGKDKSGIIETVTEARISGEKNICIQQFWAYGPKPKVYISVDELKSILAAYEEKVMN